MLPYSIVFGEILEFWYVKWNGDLSWFRNSCPFSVVQS